MTGKIEPVSVVVRSYHRRENLIRIVRALLDQDHPEFEVVVMEQSGWSKEERAPLDELASTDHRLRILYSAPLGVGGARNAGWKAAKFDIVLTIDDDDLPLGRDFVRGHARNYNDPLIVGVTGRHVYSEGEVCGYRNRARARRLCLRYNFFGYPHVFCRFDERVESVDWVHGSNGSVRKGLIERIGGYDDRATESDEHAFCLQLEQRLAPGERLVFDPTMVLLRNKDLPGGAAVRWAGPRITFRSWHRYFHSLVLRHKPHLRRLYPIFPLACWFLAMRWVWTDAKVYATVGAKLVASSYALLAGPFWYVGELLGRSDLAPGALPAHQRR